MCPRCNRRTLGDQSLRDDLARRCQELISAECGRTVETCGGDGLGAGWPTPEIAELMELSGQLLRALLVVQGRHRPTLDDMELADRLAARVLAERRGSQQRKPSEKHAA